MFSFWLNPTLAKSAGSVVWVFYQVQPQGLIFSTQKLQTTKKQTLSHLKNENNSEYLIFNSFVLSLIG